jgi:hypothetical protein
MRRIGESRRHIFRLVANSKLDMDVAFKADDAHMLSTLETSRQEVLPIACLYPSVRSTSVSAVSRSGVARNTNQFTDKHFSPVRSLYPDAAMVPSSSTC